MTNIILDEGAQNYFITADLASNLQFSVCRNTVMHIASFGGSENQIRYLDKSVIRLEIQDGSRIPMEVLIVPIIAAPIQNTSEI